MSRAFTKTLRVRVKDRHAPILSRMAISVNQVWNYVNELSHRSITERGHILSGYDLDKYTAGSSTILGITADTIQRVSAEYATKRKQFKKSKLRWRKSFGGDRSLHWIPIKTGCSKWSNGQVKYAGRHFKVWDSYGLSNYKFRSACFSEDARGRWYFNVVVDAVADQSIGTSSVGIDLGCKDAATCSDGKKLSGRWYRGMEGNLSTSQRARNKRRTRAIHAKVANRRRDALHKFSRHLVNQNAAIFVGNVSSSAMVKTRSAKSSLDAGWGILKSMLEYKCHQAGVVFDVVNEAYSTQACSSCGSIPASSPKGRADLGVRDWECSECGARHDRDINAAKNILNRGLGYQPPLDGLRIYSAQVSKEGEQ